jgi:serine/threonine protein kinase
MTTSGPGHPTTSHVAATGDLSGSTFALPSPAELAARIGNLEVLELLGHGGMGVVYKGRQPLLDRTVAIKVLRPDFQNDETFHERFLHEARMLAMLRHPYIVTVFDVGRTEEFYYLVMEYVEGPSLRRLLNDGLVSQRDVLDFVPQIAEALQHAHEAGVVHRDIKPENVLIDSRGRVRVVDFGLAKLFGPGAQSRTDDDRVAGTRGYMAPEQITMPGAVDHRADIFSTGVVFHEMLAGELPSADREPPSRKAATDPRLDPIVLRALERDRERRYQEARLMHSEIVAVARTPETSLRVEKTIPAPADRVFETWINSQEMGDWYAPFDDFGPTIGEVDPQVGGRYRVGMLPPGQQDRIFVSGEYCRVDAPRTLSFTWAWEPPKTDTDLTQVTVEFHARGETTDVVLIQERFRDPGSRDGHEKGWTGCLNRLARKLGG